eukprot:gene17474-20807_t
MEEQVDASEPSHKKMLNYMLEALSAYDALFGALSWGSFSCPNRAWTSWAAQLNKGEEKGLGGGDSPGLDDRTARYSSTYTFRLAWPPSGDNVRKLVLEAARIRSSVEAARALQAAKDAQARQVDELQAVLDIIARGKKGKRGGPASPPPAWLRYGEIP